MKRILVGLGALVLVLLLVALVVPWLIPAGVYKDRFVAEIAAATGRPVRIDGTFGFSILPNLSLVATELTLGAVPGAGPGGLITIDKAAAHIDLTPLLSGKFVVRSLRLDKPVIALSVDESGRPNWQAAAPGVAAKPADDTASSLRGALDRLAGFRLRDLRITGGKVTYADARTGARYEADSVDATLLLPSLSQPMSAEATLLWRKQKINLALRLADPRALLAGGPAAVTVAATAGDAKLDFTGTVAAEKTAVARGTLSLETASLRQLFAAAGEPLDPSGTGFGRLKLAGTLDVDGSTIALREASFAFDAVTGTGELRCDIGGARPHVTAKLALGPLDLNPYLPPVRGVWSTASIDLAALRPLDGDFDIALGGLTVRRVTIGAAHVAMALKDGKLTATATDTRVYGGAGNARMVLDAAEVPAIELSGTLSGVQAGPFLAAAIGVSRLDGTAAASLQASGRGNSERDIVATLAGSGRFQVENGAIHSGDLMASVLNAVGALLKGGAGASGETAFSRLSGSFTIRNGEMVTNDLALQSPLLSVAGRGTVSLPRRRLDYRLDATLLAAAKIEIAGVTLAQLTVPITVSGPWEDVQYRTDVGAALAGIGNKAALQRLQTIIPDTGGLGRALSNAPAAANPAKLIPNLFGR